MPDPAQQTCRNCAGPLPPPVVRYVGQGVAPQRDPGPEPPPPPRSLPSKYRNKVLYWGNVWTILGIVFTIVFSWTIVFAALGILFWVLGYRRGLREIRALEQGRAVLGQIVGVHQDRSQTMNGRNPWVVTYQFPTASGLRQENDQGWDSSNAYFRHGDPVWVVSVEGEEGCSAIWPPVR